MYYIFVDIRTCIPELSEQHHPPSPSLDLASRAMYGTENIRNEP